MKNLNVKQVGIGGAIGAALVAGATLLVKVIKNRRLNKSVESYEEFPSDEETQTEE